MSLWNRLKNSKLGNILSFSDGSFSTMPGCVFPHAEFIRNGDRHVFMLADFLNRCNLRCVMCNINFEKDSPKVSLEPGEFQRVAIKAGPKSFQANLSCLYEPLMSKHIFENLNFIIQYRIPKITITTNALLLNDTAAQKVLNSQLPQMNISVDAATKSTYEKIRRSGDFDILLNNLRYFADLKQQRESAGPKLQFQFVMMEENMDEMTDFVRRFAEFRPFKFVFIHYNYAVPEPSKRQSIENALGNALKECVQQGFLFEEVPNHCLSFEEIIAAYGGQADEIPRFNQGCLDPWCFMRIAPDGNVFRCPADNQPVGNIHQTDITKIWNGEKYRQLRQQLNAGTPPPLCQQCPYSARGLVQLRRAQDKMEKILGALVTR